MGRRAGKLVEMVVVVVRRDFQVLVQSLQREQNPLVVDCAAEGEAGAHTLTAPGLLVGVVVLLLVGGDGVHRPTLDAGEDQAEELMRMQREHARLEVEGQ
mmetsp:Transcript_18369/g.51525  ORF Transcript_18369/g.51525 Transcript_18369/m.51525 type:complete len:100 (-) Transcript_18369:361-660(-)